MKNRSVGLTALCCCGLFAAAAVLRSQSTLESRRPYVAIAKTTIYTAEPGKPEVIKQIIRTTEARDSQGRRYTSAPAHIPSRFRYDWIRDVVAGRSYRVNRQQKVAYFTNLDPTDSRPDLSRPDVLNSGMQVTEISGVQCVNGPLRRARPDGGSELLGTSCVSFELGVLKVHGDHWVNIGGENLHFVSELEDLQLDTEPPPDWFQIPGDFKLIPGDPGKPVPQN
jgi:hypothetical protein